MSTISAEEVARHNTRDDAWIAIDGKVYDMTGYMKGHPGGTESIMRKVGVDASTGFHAEPAHRGIIPYVGKILRRHVVGDFDPNRERFIRDEWWGHYSYELKY